MGQRLFMKTEVKQNYCLPSSYLLAFIPLDFPSSNSVPCVEAVHFVSFLHEVAITSRIVHTVVPAIGERYLHILVGSMLDNVLTKGSSP